MYVQRCKTFKKHFKEIIKVKFKKMTQKQRDYGRLIAIAAMVIIILIGMLSSCTPQLYKNQINVTHVLALTEEGDTIKIPINQIRPNVVYNVIGYDYYRPYYNRWNPFNTYYDPYYHPNTYKPKPSYNVNSNINNFTVFNRFFCRERESVHNQCKFGISADDNRGESIIMKDLQ